MELQNKTAVITGISSGIGKALALQLLEKGARVAGWGLHKPDYKHKNLFFVKTNVRNLQEVETAFQKTQAHFGEEIHVLANNAGLGYFGYLENMSPEQWNEIFEVNVNSIFYTCRLIIPQMKKQDFGHIINISSIAGLEGISQTSAYCGAKHAVKGITDSLFKELREFGIKVTGVYPGSVSTGFFNRAGVRPYPGPMSPEEVALQIVRALETSNNFLINNIEFRPLRKIQS
jgi:NAD(P)-dependent dehydrogenase (short-subunit alcohol dehydrogenase family)